MVAHERMVGREQPHRAVTNQIGAAVADMRRRKNAVCKEDGDHGRTHAGALWMPSRSPMDDLIGEPNGAGQPVHRQQDIRIVFSDKGKLVAA